MNKKTQSECLKMPYPIELVIFDCDGVLIDSEVISFDVLRIALLAVGVDVSVDYFYRHFLGRSFTHVKENIRTNFNQRLPADFESNYQQSLLKVFATRLKPTAGVRSVIEQLGIPYCVATSSSPSRTKKALELTGLNDLFTDNVFTASRVKNGKPAPDLFLFAADKMGVKPKHCLVIEDSAVGLEAAQASGMTVWQYLGGSHMSSLKSLRTDSNLDVEQGLSITRFSSWQNFYKMAANLKN